MFLNCGVKKDSWESLDCKIQPVHPKGNQSWIFTGRTDAEAEPPVFGHLTQSTDTVGKTLLLGGTGGRRRGDGRGWDGWVASPTRWTWVWVDSGSWWWTGRPGVLWFMGSQRVGHDWVAELNWTEEKLGKWYWDFCFVSYNYKGIHNHLNYTGRNHIWLFFSLLDVSVKKHFI